MKKGHSMTDEIDQARKRVARAASNSLTDQDRLELSTVSTNCRNDHEGAVYLLNQVLEKVRNETRAEKARQLDLFDQGLMYPTGQDTAMAANDILRGSLFGPVKRGTRKLVQGLTVLKWGKDIEMTYSGAQLDQADLDTLLALGRMIQTNGANIDNTIRKGKDGFTRVTCSSRSLLDDMGRATGGNSMKWLYSSLDRLGGKIRLSRRNLRGQWRIISTPMVGSWGHDEDTRTLVINVNHDFIEILRGGHTIIDWQKRLSFSTFGKWLYGFVCTHEPGKTQYQTTRKLMTSYGSHHGRCRDFLKRELRPALAALDQEGIIDTWAVRGHMITWTRSQKQGA